MGARGAHARARSNLSEVEDPAVLRCRAQTKQTYGEREVYCVPVECRVPQALRHNHECTYEIVSPEVARRHAAAECRPAFGGGAAVGSGPGSRPVSSHTISSSLRSVRIGKIPGENRCRSPRTRRHPKVQGSLAKISDGAYGVRGRQYGVRASPRIAHAAIGDMK